MSKSFYKGRFKTKVSAEIEIELTKEDVFNWLNECDDPKALRYLGNAALRFAQALENTDDDDFRSRA